MFRHHEIRVEISDAQENTLLVEVWTPVGKIELMGDIAYVERVLHVTGVHIDGNLIGVLGRAGLNAIGRRLLEEADVDEIVIAGSRRTTGRTAGRHPRTIRFPRRQRVD